MSTAMVQSTAEAGDMTSTQGLSGRGNMKKQDERSRSPIGCKGERSLHAPGRTGLVEAEGRDPL